MPSSAAMAAFVRASSTGRPSSAARRTATSSRPGTPANAASLGPPPVATRRIARISPARSISAAVSVEREIRSTSPRKAARFCSGVASIGTNSIGNSSRLAIPSVLTRLVVEANATGVAELAVPKVVDRADGGDRRHHEHLGVGVDLSQHVQLVQPRIAGPAGDRGEGDDAAVEQAERQPVRRGVADRPCPSDAAGLGDVVDHDLGPERRLEVRLEQPGDGVVAAAGRVGHDQPDGAADELGTGRGRRQRRSGEAQQHQGHGERASHSRLLQASSERCCSMQAQRVQRAPHQAAGEAAARHRQSVTIARRYRERQSTAGARWACRSPRKRPRSSCE